MKVRDHERRVLHGADRDDFVNIACVVLIEYRSVTDRQTLGPQLMQGYADAE